MNGEIQYGFGPDYLDSWTVRSALREIYQNFIDHGEYTESIVAEGDHVRVSVSNDWNPVGLEFLRVGNSTKKDDPSAIGKHGEGFKMGAMILHREGLEMTLRTPRFTVWPEFESNDMIGEVFVLKYREEDNGEGVSVEFTCCAADFEEFKDGVLTDADTVFDDKYYGRIVSKPAGSIYSGGLFVCRVDNISKAYDIRPQHMNLDRDRQVPRSFDVSWASSKINQAHGKWEAKDMTMSDTMFVDRIPDHVVRVVKPVVVGKDVHLAWTDDTGETVIVKNENVVAALKREGFIARAIRRIKAVLARSLGLYDMLVEFEKKHVHTAEARADFAIILAKAGAEEQIQKPTEETPF